MSLEEGEALCVALRVSEVAPLSDDEVVPICVGINVRVGQLVSVCVLVQRVVPIWVAVGLVVAVTLSEAVRDWLELSELINVAAGVTDRDVEKELAEVDVTVCVLETVSVLLPVLAFVEETVVVCM